MKKLNLPFKHICHSTSTRKGLLFYMALLSTILIFAQTKQATQRAYAPSLGNAASFAVFGGGGGVTNQGSLTILHGSLGTTSVSTAVTGFTDGVSGNPYTTAAGSNNGNVTGGIYSNNGDPVTFAFAQLTSADILTAYQAIAPAAQLNGVEPNTTNNGELGGLTLNPGVYKSAVGFFNITGSDLTLDANNDPNAVWIFQTASSLTVGAPGFPRSVTMTNGGLARNVYWYVGSGAVINTGGGGTMCGNIISSAAITTSTAASTILTTINGRILCLNAGVTLVNTIVNACDTWTGKTSSIWSTATNWSRGSVPIASEEVLIPNVLTTKPIVSSTTQPLFNLTIYSGSALTVTSTLQIGGFINNLGNAFDATNGTITMNGVGTVTKNGVLPQFLPPAFTSNNTVQNLIISNPANDTLGGNINVSNLFTLSNGLLKTGTNILIIGNNATTANASNVRYVDGNVRKIGTQAFIFPVGNLGKYAPISISAPSSPTDHFTASYSFSNPNNSSYLTTSLGSGLNKVSSTEFWLLNRTNGTSNVDVTLNFDASHSGGISSLADLRVALWNGSQWTNQGNTNTTGNAGNNPNGTVRSNPSLSAFGPFTLGSSTASNTLPVNLLSFTAQRQSNNIALAWLTTNELNTTYFNVQRSTDGVNFGNNGKVATKGSGSYGYNDDIASVTPQPATIFYRLQIVDNDGSFVYSKVLAVSLNSKIQTLNLYPNPVKETLFVQLNSAKAEKITLQVIDMQGKILKQQIVQAVVGNVSLSIDASAFAKGTYTLLVKGTETMLKKQFVKE